MSKLISVVIPARNEQDNIGRTVEGIRTALDSHNILFEIIVVNDNSTDSTAQVVQELSRKDARVRVMNNEPPFGFGYAVRQGLDSFQGDYVIIAMADASDEPKDMVKYIREVEKGFDCCFGNRWCREAVVEGYPRFKLVLNRLVNGFIRMVFGLPFSDVTNAFKCYSRETIKGIKPILSRHFNITVELPLKAVVRGFSYAVVPTDWKERRRGRTSFKLQEMGSRYLFIILYIWLEKALCGNDYKRGKA